MKLWLTSAITMAAFWAAVSLIGCAEKPAPAPVPVWVDTVKPIPRTPVMPQKRLSPSVKFTPKVQKRDTVIVRDTVFLKPPAPIKSKHRRVCKEWA